jgi:predicted enzyme related to lactoylglutathione lyase
MRSTARVGTFVLLCGAVVLSATRSAPQGAAPDPGPFTGDVKPVLYVKDVERSARFFRDVLGFEFLGYAETGGKRYYAEMAAGSRKFGLHAPLNDEHREWVGHQRLYFRVKDVGAHRSFVEARGGAPGELVETAWMDMFIVRDPDGHQIVFAETDPGKHSTDPWRNSGATQAP